MKTMKKLQVAVAAASLFVAAGSSMAAAISQSGITVAREAISANTAATQTLRAPTVSYSFDNGPTANANSTQDFNVTLVLGGDPNPTGAAEWTTQGAPAFYRTVAAYRRNNGNAVVPVLPFSELANVGVNKAALVLMSVEVGTADLDVGVDATSNKKQKLRYKFRLVNNTASSISIGDLQLAFNGQNPGDGAAAPWNTGNATAFGGAEIATANDYAIVTKLATVVNQTPVTSGNDAGKTGNNADDCGEGIRKVTVLARNYIGSGDGVQGESQGAQVQSILNGGYIQFNTALAVHVEQGVAKDRNTNPLAGNQELSILGAANDPLVMALGTVQFTNRAGIDAFDTALTVPYYKFGANDLDGVGNETNGDVDVASLELKIDATNGFAAGTEIGLSNSPVCDAGSDTIWANTSSLVGNTLTANFTAANLANVFNTTGSLQDVTDPGAVASPFNIAGNTNKAFICMHVPGDTLIPQSRYQNAVATLYKNHTTPPVGLEQANYSCPATLAGLGGGVKVDVRNFTEFPAGAEWIDYIRVINNSETVTADVAVQYIKANGKYGKWVSLGTLAPREAKFFSNHDIKAAMTATGVVSKDANAAPAAEQMLATNEQGRLRVSSESASTLRVQNYFVNVNQGILNEVSGSQGADFVNIEASPRDHIDQDAQTGIKK